MRLQDFAKTVYRQHYKDLWIDGGDAYIDQSFSSDQLSMEIEDPLVRYFYILCDSDIAGFLKVVLPAADCEQGLYLARLYLSADQTGNGLGSQSLAFVDRYARGAGLERIWLQAIKCRRDVCRFYQRHGYSVCGETQLPEKNIVPGRERVLVMEKCLATINDSAWPACKETGDRPGQAVLRLPGHPDARRKSGLLLRPDRTAVRAVCKGRWSYDASRYYEMLFSIKAFHA